MDYSVKGGARPSVRVLDEKSSITTAQTLADIKMGGTVLVPCEGSLNAWFDSMYRIWMFPSESIRSGCRIDYAMMGVVIKNAESNKKAY